MNSYIYIIVFDHSLEQNLHEDMNVKFSLSFAVFMGFFKHKTCMQVMHSSLSLRSLVMGW